MLLFHSGRSDEVGAIDLNRPDAGRGNGERRGGSMNRPYLCFVWLVPFLLSIAVPSNHLFAQSKGNKKKQARAAVTPGVSPDRKSTRLNSSHQIISYAVFCLKKKKTT